MKSIGRTAICALFLWCGLVPCWLQAQTVEDDPIGYGDIKLGASIFGLPIACLRPVVCEGSYESAWVLVWHADAHVGRVDVIYAGRDPESGSEIRSSPITLPQAIRSHSFRYGQKTPRLGYAGNEGSSRIVVDVANGIVYLADAVSETGLVREVRYLPMTDPLVEKGSALLLSNHGVWLVRAALLTRLGDKDRARAAYDRAIALETDPNSRCFLERGRDALMTSRPAR